MDKKTAIIEFCNDASEFELVMNIVEYLLDEVDDDTLASLCADLGLSE